MGSAVSTSRPTSSNHEKKKKVAKIPLNIALLAIVKIQSQYRRRMAQQRFEEIREIVMEERRLAELQRQADEEENAEEETPMITSSMQGSTKTPSMNHRNRFMRKVIPADQLAALSEDDTPSFGSSFDPSSVMSKYTPLGDSVIIYPLVGFVVKSRSNLTGKKIFLNICHHETVMTMEATPVREINDSTAAVFARDTSSSLLPGISSVGRPYTANSMMNTSFNGSSSMLGGGASNMIQIGDVILPSPEYEECFSYDEDQGMVPIDGNVRQEIARQAIKFWNITHQEDISDVCTFPKMKRGYFGDLLPLTLHMKTKALTHLPSALKASQASVRDPKGTDDSLQSLNFSAKDSSNHAERFLLPYATELRSWVDLSSMRTRKEMEGTATPTAATAHALAVVEHVTAPKLSNHSVKFSSRRVTSGTVELITPRIFIPQVPLFGPAYAAELMATLPTPAGSANTAVFPAISSTRSAQSVIQTSGFGDAETSPPPSPGTSTGMGGTGIALTPHRPGQPKQLRSTVGPGVPTAPTSGTPDNSNKAVHRLLSNPLGRNKGGAAATPGALNLASLEEDDETSRSYNSSGPSAPAASSAARAKEGLSVHRPNRNNNNNESSSRPGNKDKDSSTRSTSKDQAFAKSSPQMSSRMGTFDSPTKSSPSQHFSFSNMGFAEPTELPTIMPVFVVLSQGMLYVYNRDPTRGTYYPYSNNPNSNANKKQLTSVPSTGSLNTASRGVGSYNISNNKAVNKHEYRPLIEYARIMLTEDCITTSHILTQTSTTFILHFHAPLANKVTPEDTLAVLYTHFSDVVPGGNVSIQLRSFSELRTWKAHLRSHIQAGTAARRRVINDYIANTMINKSYIGRKLTPKAGEVQCLQYPDSPKVFVRIEHGMLQIYDEKVPGESVGKNLLHAVQLTDKTVTVRTETQKDNSTNIILTLDVAENSVFSRGGSAEEIYEFVFHKAYAMNESDSQDYSEFLQRNIQLAQNRYRAYLLPLLEHKQGVSVVNNTCDITTVKLTVGTGDDMDSDDEDDDETEDALKKHTLLSIYYIAHPQPEEEVKRKADLSIAPPPASGSVSGASGNINKEPLPASLYTASGSFSEPAKNNNAEDSAADAKAKNSASPQDDENKNAIEEIMTKMQKNIGEVPTFDVVLTGQMLYFFHDMRYHFSLNLTRCGDKPAFRRAKALEKIEVSKLIAKILKEQQKASVFYLDSSSDSEAESGGAGGEDEASEHEDDDGRSVASMSVNNPRGALARALSTASMNGTAPSPLNPAASPVPTAAPPPLSKTKSSVGRNPRSRPVKSIDSAAPPVSSFSDKNTADKVVMLKTKGGKVLPESKAPPNYPITTWAIQLVSFDNRVYTLKFKTAEEYHEWRELLFFAGGEAVDPLFPLSSNSSTATATSQRNSVSMPLGFSLTKEDSFSHPETTTSTFSSSPMPSGAAAATFSVVNKNDAKYVDLDATKKFARLLRKDEKVLSAGQVLKHDSVAVTKNAAVVSATAPKPRRILVLTDAPRLLFLDPVGNIVRGNLELSNEGPVEVKMASIMDFDVIIGGTLNKFTSTELTDKNAVFWTTKIKQAINMR